MMDVGLKEGQGLEQFFGNIGPILERVQQTQKENIVAAAEIIAKSIADGGVVHTFGAGHSSVVAADLSFRTGTLVPIHHVYDGSTNGSSGALRASGLERLEGYGDAIFDNLQLEPADCFIVISNSGRNPAGIDFAKKGSENGHGVIALVSLAYSNAVSSRHSSGKKLQDYASVTLDNCGGLGDVCVEVDWLEQGIGPISTVTGSFILHALMVESTFALKRKGIDPPVFMSSNLDQGDAFNAEHIRKYRHRIPNW